MRDFIAVDQDLLQQRKVLLARQIVLGR